MRNAADLECRAQGRIGVASALSVRIGKALSAVLAEGTGRNLVSGPDEGGPETSRLPIGDWRSHTGERCPSPFSAWRDRARHLRADASLEFVERPCTKAIPTLAPTFRVFCSEHDSAGFDARDAFIAECLECPRTRVLVRIEHDEFINRPCGRAWPGKTQLVQALNR